MRKRRRWTRPGVLRLTCLMSGDVAAVNDVNPRSHAAGTTMGPHADAAEGSGDSGPVRDGFSGGSRGSPGLVVVTGMGKEQPKPGRFNKQ